MLMCYMETVNGLMEASTPPDLEQGISGLMEKSRCDLPVVHNVPLVLQGIHVWGMWKPVRNITAFILQESQTRCSHTWPSTVEHQVWGQLDQHMV